MFILKLYDRKGKELRQGDIVKISNGRSFDFFCEVTFLEKEQVIAPFHTFSFHSFEKVSYVPKEAVKSTEERYNCWYMYNPQDDPEAPQFEKYLMEWRECESLVNTRCWRIEKADKRVVVKGFAG